MKIHISILTVLLITASISNAQSDLNNKSKFQKVCGDVFTGFFTGRTITTKKTYHNIMYGFGDNSARITNGYLLPRKWDTYIVYSKILNNDKQYLGFGIEKMIKICDIKCFLFFEPGINLKGTNSLTIGVLVSGQSMFWKRT